MAFCKGRAGSKVWRFVTEGSDQARPAQQQDCHQAGAQSGKCKVVSIKHGRYLPEKTWLANASHKAVKSYSRNRRPTTADQPRKELNQSLMRMQILIICVFLILLLSLRLNLLLRAACGRRNGPRPLLTRVSLKHFRAALKRPFFSPNATPLASAHLNPLSFQNRKGPALFL